MKAGGEHAVYRSVARVSHLCGCRNCGPCTLRRRGLGRQQHCSEHPLWDLTTRPATPILLIMTDQSVSTRKKDVILDAARTVFSRKGYAETAVDDVAEEAGIAKGTLYLYFKSKEQL